MQSIKRAVCYIVLALVINSCIEPFFPKELDYDPMLFIQALVTDNSHIPATVELSNTIPLRTSLNQNIDYVEISGAIIYISHEDNTRFYFSETEEGRYQLTDPAFALSPGSSYKLVVETSDGHRFESGYEAYRQATPVDAIDYEYAEEKLSQMGELHQGYKFNISASGDGAETTYFRWVPDHTYMYQVPLQAEKMWNGSQRIDSMSYEFSVCFKDEDIKGIYIGSTAGLSENRIVGSPLHFVSQYGDMLQVEYSLHTYQYRISEAAFNFWYDLRKLIYETGGLYEIQPFKLTGNISCVTDPPVNVAGIFEVAGVSEKRIFVPRPTDFVVVTDKCEPYNVGAGIYPWRLVPRGSWIIDNDDGFFLTAPNSCFDCREKGGYTARPPFWE
jgi:hypothetical protein